MKVRTREHSQKKNKIGQNHIFKKYRTPFLHVLLFMLGSIYMVQFSFETSVYAWTLVGYMHFVLHVVFFVYLTIIFLIFFYTSLIYGIIFLFKKITHVEYHKDLSLIQEAIFESKNLSHSLKYYDTGKIKVRFQKDMFWKSIKEIFKLYSFVFFLTYVGFILTAFISLKMILIGVFFIMFFISLILLGPYFSFLKNNKHIQIKTLSFSPKTYAWKDKHTLYFK